MQTNPGCNLRCVCAPILFYSIHTSIPIASLSFGFLISLNSGEELDSACISLSSLFLEATKVRAAPEVFSSVLAGKCIFARMNPRNFNLYQSYSFLMLHAHAS